MNREKTTGNFDMILQDSIYSWMQRTYKENGASTATGNIAIGSIKGTVRDENQDRAAVITIYPHSALSKLVQVAVLCDGIGGLKEGSEAATLAISSFISQLVHINDDNISGFIELAAKYASNIVYSKYNGKGGCTLSAVCITESGIVDMVNYGDSRIYLQNEESLIQVSTDDTLDGQLAKLEQPLERSFPELKQLVQYIGMDGPIETSSISFDSINSCDSILLVSDGVNDVDVSIVQKVLMNSRSNEEGIRKLLQISEWISGKDNATAIYFNKCSESIKCLRTEMPTIEIWTWSANYILSVSSCVPNSDIAKTFIGSSKNRPKKTGKMRPPKTNMPDKSLGNRKDKNGQQIFFEIVSDDLNIGPEQPKIEFDEGHEK